MNTPNIEKLLVRYYNDELPADQTARVAAWIAASEENRKIAEQVYYICFAAETQEAKAALDTAAALRKVKGRIRTEKWRRMLRQTERAARAARWTRAPDRSGSYCARRRIDIWGAKC